MDSRSEVVMELRRRRSLFVGAAVEEGESVDAEAATAADEEQQRTRTLTFSLEEAATLDAKLTKCDETLQTLRASIDGFSQGRARAQGNP